MIIKNKNFQFLMILLFVFETCTAIAQQKGVIFENGKTWNEILLQAKAEHKFIFVDCFATWCGPCRQMDNQVYPDETVGNFLNTHFVSVKMQMDTSKLDSDLTKKLYPDAHLLSSVYGITAFPTYLFFDEEGKIVHRNLGFLRAHDFIEVAKAALDPQTQYYTLLKSYQEGTLTFPQISQLAKTANSIDEKHLANRIAAFYIHNYLDKLNDQDFLTKRNVDFMVTFAKAVSSDDKLFEICYKRPASIDSLVHDVQFSNRWVNYIIFNEELMPSIEEAKQNNKEPDWSRLSENIANKYGEQYVADNILSGRINWCHFKKDASGYTKYLTEKEQNAIRLNGILSGLSGLVTINGAAMEVFLYDNNPLDLKKAFGWVTKLLDQNPKLQGQNLGALLDTKANLLYKLGKKKEAILLEEKAVAMAPEDKGITANFHKMKKGEKTWPNKMP